MQQQQHLFLQQCALARKSAEQTACSTQHYVAPCNIGCEPANTTHITLHILFQSVTPTHKCIFAPRWRAFPLLAADPAGSYPSPPVLNPSSVPTYEVKYGRSIFVNLTQHGLHSQGGKLSSELVAYPSHGTVELVWEYVLRGYNDIDTDAFLTGVRYTPTGGYTGPDEISFRLLDIWRWWRSVDVGTVRFAVKPAAAAPCNMASCRAGGLCAGTKCGGPANGGCPQVPVVGANACICDATQGFMPGPVVNVAVAAFYQPEQHCA